MGDKKSGRPQTLGIGEDFKLSVMKAGHFTQEQAKQMEELASLEGISCSKLIRKAVTEYLRIK